MAVNIGPKIGIDGEAQYRREIQNIIQQQKTLNSEMKQTESAFDRTTSAQEKARQKSKILNEQIDVQRKRVEKLREQLEKSEEKYGSSATQTLKWKEAVQDATTELNKLNDELAENNSLKAFGEDMQESGKKIQAVGETITGIGKTATAAVTVPIVAAGTAAVKSAADFESSFSKVGTIMDDTAISSEDMKKQMRDLSDETGVSMSDIADATYQAISAGQDSAKAVDFVGESLKLATAGMTDATTATDVLTTVLNAYGDEAGTAAEVSDTLMTIQNKGKTTIAELGSSMGKVIPTAAMYGVGLEQIAGAYVTTTKNGIGTAESTTYINSMLNELGNSGKKAAKVLKNKTGKSFKELMEDGWDLDGVLGILQDTADETGVSIGDMFGSQEAAKAAATIVQHTEDFNGALNDVEKSAGTTEEAFKKMQDTTETKLNKAMNELKNVGIEVGEEVLPTVVDIVERVADVVEKASDAWESMTDEEKDAALKGVALVAAFGPVVTAIGKVVEGVGLAQQGIGALVTAIGGGGAGASLGLIGTVGGVLGPLALLAGAFTAVHDEQSKLPDDFVAADKAVEELGKKIADTTSGLDGLVQSISDTSGKLETSSAGVEHWRDELNKCYDESGNLKKGMESVAEYALNQLNNAMGTDYSTEFIAQAKDSKQALQDLNTEVDNYIDNLKKQAIESAYSSEIAEATKLQAEAQAQLTEAQAQYDQAVKDTTESFEQFRAAQALDDDNERIEKCNQWSAALEDAKSRLAETGAALSDAEANAAMADSTVQGLNSTVDTLAKGGSIDEVAEQYGNIGVNAQNAADEARKAADNTIQSWDDIRKQVVEAPAIKGEKMEQSGKDVAAKTYKGMDVIISDPMDGKVDKVNGGNAAASTAYNGMDKEISKPMSGTVSKVYGAAAAASAARAEAQGYMDRNPISVAVNVVRNIVEKVSSVFSGVAHNAQGGIVATEQLSWLAEGNKAEAVIPLEGNRARALELYRQTGQILGVSNMMYLPEQGGFNAGATQQTSGSAGVDTAAIYNAVRQGMEDANVGIYIGEREFGRTLRGMGVTTG